MKIRDFEILELLYRDTGLVVMIKMVKKVFFNIKKEAKPIVIQLRNEKFNRLILGADNAEKIVDAINNNIK
ncbi:hypothetical protein GCM10025878_15670 [Leuconostoc gasicomitatum]|nr:hypothetical protein GCM10025878_15670 [Leuconostoc gasicomitatum]